MAPRLWIAASCFTTTLRSARRLAPRASVTVMIAGRSSGVSPTASASANISDWRSGRSKRTFVMRTKSTMKTVSRSMSMPNWLTPSSNVLGGAASWSVRATWPSRVALPVTQTTARALPVATRVARKTELVAVLAPSAVSPRSRGTLLDRIGFAGEQRLVDGEVARLDEAAVGGHQVAGIEHDDIAGDERLDRHLSDRPVAHHVGLDRDRAGQRLHRVLGLALLNEIEDDAQEHDRGDDGEAGEVAGQSRQAAREEEKQNERIGEAAHELPPCRRAPDGNGAVRAILREPRLGLGRGETGLRRPQPLHHLGKRLAPEA